MPVEINPKDVDDAYRYVKPDVNKILEVRLKDALNNLPRLSTFPSTVADVAFSVERLDAVSIKSNDDLKNKLMSRLDAIKHRINRQPIAARQGLHRGNHKMEYKQ